MIKRFKYIYTDPEGRQTELKKAITDRMEPRDNHKKIYAAACFTEMLRASIGYTGPITVRNIQEV